MDEFDGIFERYPRDERHSLAILMDIQNKYNYIPREALAALAERLGVKVSRLYAMATFYRALSLTPKGRHIIKICDGTACHIRGTPVLLDALCRELDIKGCGTTGDGLFSLETVNCLGACALAPVMVVDGKYETKVAPGGIAGILERYRSGGEAA